MTEPTKEDLQELKEMLERSMGSFRTSIDHDAEIFKKYGKSLAELTPLQQAEAKAAMEESKARAASKLAIEDSKEAFQKFTKALLEGGGEFSKYSSAVSKTTDAISGLASQFGIAGKAFGLLIKGLGVAAEAYFKQADNVLKASDTITKFAGVGKLTTNDLLDLAHSAKLTSKNLDLLVKPLQSLGPSLVSLGSTANEGVKSFGKLAEITYDTREQYQRLGVSQGELLQNQADYIKLQTISGRNLKNELKDREALRKASLDYTDNLLTLAEITGKDVESIKKQQQEASRAVDWQISQINLENKARKAEAEGRTEDAKRFRDEAKRRQEALEAIAGLGNEEVTKGVRQILATGTLAGEQAQKLALLGLTEDVYKLSKALKTGQNAQESAAEFQDSYNKKFGKAIEQFGFASQVSKDVADRLGMTEKSLEQFNLQRDQNLKDQTKLSKEELEARKKSGADPAKDARAKLTTAEIAAGQALDRLVQATNPLIKGFGVGTITLGLFVGAVTAAALALTKMAGGSTLGGITSGLMGGIGRSGLGGGFAAGVGGAASRGVGGAVAGAAGGIGAGVGAGVEGVMGGLGKDGGALMKGAAVGLEAFGNPMILKGAAILSGAIAIIGAGIAGATWIMGKALPSLASGLGAFTKINGEKLQATGKGLGAIGLGLAQFTAGNMVYSMGKMATILPDFISGIFGQGSFEKSPIGKFITFSKQIEESKIDPDKAKKAAEAFGAFGAAMGKAGEGAAAGAKGVVVGAIADSIAKFLDVDLPVEKFAKFAELDIPPKIIRNVKAFAEFNTALASVKKPTGVGIGDIFSEALAKGLSNFLDVDLPVEKFAKFAELEISPKVSRNIKAFAEFNNALASMKKPASIGVGDIISEAFTKKIADFLDVDLPIEKFAEFAKLDIPPTAMRNAKAFMEFSNAMASYKKPTTIEDKDIISEAHTKRLANFLDVDLPVAKFQKFAQLKIPKSAIGNAKAFMEFSNAMASYKKPDSMSIGEIFSEKMTQGIAKFLGVDLPVEKFEKFANMDINPDAGRNAKAFVEFSKAMASFKGGSSTGMMDVLSEKASGVLSKWLKVDLPWDKFKKFSDLQIGEGAERNAKVFGRFSEAMSRFKGVPSTSFADSLLGFVGKMFGKKDVIQQFEEFTKLKVDPDKAEKLAEAFKNYAEALGILSGGAPGRPGRPSRRPAAPPTPSRRPAAPPTPSRRPAAPPTPGRAPAPPPTPGRAPAPPPGREPAAPGGPPAGKAPGAPGDVTGYLKAVSLIESGGNASAKAGTSSASGLFQFTEGTWKQTVKEMGKNYSLDDRFDPVKSSEVAAYFTHKQKAQLEKGTGKEASSADLYMAHFLGAGGATKFLNALKRNPDAPASEGADPAAIKANQSIFMTSDHKMRSLQEVYDLMAGKVSKAEQAVQTGKWGKKDVSGVMEQIEAGAGSSKSSAKPVTAQYGGIFEGSNLGYPAELHGREIVAPLDTNSLLQKLATTPAQATEPVGESTTGSGTTAMPEQSLTDMVNLQSELLSMLSEKLDSMLYKLDAGNDIQDKILRYSRA